MTALRTPDIPVIGPCVVSSCQRAATRHLVLSVGAGTLFGAVCDHCDRASRLAAFLLELAA